MKKIFLLSVLLISSSAVNALTNGIANISNSTAKANVIIAGPLVSKHAYYAGDISISSNQTIFYDSRIKGSITIKSTQKNPVLELHCKTKITGDVTFVGEQGLIKKSTDSVIGGKVTNAKVEELPAGEKCS